MNFTNSALKVYYRKTVVNGSDNDTVISGVPQTYMASSPEVISNNIIKLDIDASIKQMVANGDAIVMAPSGYEVEVQFPIQEIINSYKNRTTQGLSVINNLELEIPVEEIKTQYDIAPPKYLLMVKTNHKNDFIAGDSLTNSKDSFYAIYDASKKTYDFSQLRDYIINIIENQGGVATEDDKQFTITPMDVTTYTTAASYYTASTTTVTKIAPQVSVPAIAKLRLDKAKVKITYSTQTNM